MRRKIIQIAVDSDSDLYALGSDGTLWIGSWGVNGVQWREMTKLPELPDPKPADLPAPKAPKVVCP